MSLLPLFPLPNVVLFPGAMLPLHIFEPRYRAMTAEALAGDRRIGMVLLKPGWESDYNGTPPIFPIGCSGIIVHASQLDDGRYNIILRGVERVRILSEDHARPYRRATVEAMADTPLADADRTTLRDLRSRLIAVLGPEHADPLPEMPDADFVHALAQSLDLDPLEKQALLEYDNVCARASALVVLLEMKRLRDTAPGAPDVRH